MSTPAPLPEVIVIDRGARLERAAGWAVLTGFDHYTAWAMAFTAALTVALGGGWALLEGLVAPALWGVVAAAVVGLAARTCRFRLEITATDAVFEQRMLFVRYRQRPVGAGGELGFSVWGTGDWGLEGWSPIEKFCEVEEGGRCTEIRIGPAWAAEAICTALRDELRRLRPGVEPIRPA